MGDQAFEFERQDTREENNPKSPSFVFTVSEVSTSRRSSCDSFATAEEGGPPTSGHEERPSSEGKGRASGQAAHDAPQTRAAGTDLALWNKAIELEQGRRQDWGQRGDNRRQPRRGGNPWQGRGAAKAPSNKQRGGKTQSATPADGYVPPHMREPSRGAQESKVVDLLGAGPVVDIPAWPVMPFTN